MGAAAAVSLNLSNEGGTTETPVHMVTEIARSPMDKDSTDPKLSEQASSGKPVPTEDEEKQKKKDEKKRKKREKREGESLEETKKRKAEKKEKKAKQKDLPMILPNILTEIKMDTSNVDDDKDMSPEKTEIDTDLFSLPDEQNAPVKVEAAAAVSDVLPINNAPKIHNLDTSNINFETDVTSEISKVEVTADLLTREDEETPVMEEAAAVSEVLPLTVANSVGSKGGKSYTTDDDEKSKEEKQRRKEEKKRKKE